MKYNPHMADPIEIMQTDIQSFSTFISKERSIGNMPKTLQIQDDLKFGLLALEKWSEKSGKETSGVAWINPLGDIAFRELSVGAEDLVPIFILDLTSYTAEKASRRLSIMEPNKVFVLISDNESRAIPHSDNITIERGKMIAGSIHVHPSGNPPSAGDFSIMLFSEETMKGVIAGEDLYMFIRSQETPKPELDSTKNGQSNSLADYQEEMELEVEALEKKGLSYTDAQIQILIKHSQQNNMSLYKGKMENNRFQKIV